MSAGHAGDEAPAQPTPPRTWVTDGDLEPGDAYLEGPYVVFTAQYHLRRGYCCNSGCRHCPYRGDSGDADGSA